MCAVSAGDISTANPAAIMADVVPDEESEEEVDPDTVTLDIGGEEKLALEDLEGLTLEEPGG